MIAWKRKHVLLTLAAVGLIVAGCGDDDPAPIAGDVGADTDPGTDTTPDDDTTPDEDATNVCGDAPECVRLSDCDGLGFNQPQCEVAPGASTGCCVEGDVGPDPGSLCQSHLSECSSPDQTTADFFCDADAGLCLQRCDFDRADDTQSADCPLNSYCLSELTGGDPTELNGVCIPGDCESNIFDPESCDGIGTCLPVGNGASFCIEGGTAAEGDACNTVQTNQPASDICEPGLLCRNSACIVPCDRRNGDDDCTEDGEECLGVFDTTPRNQPGLCGVDCTPFSRDECADGMCAPVFGRFGINGWACSEMPDEPLAEGDNCGAADAVCGEGLICLTVSEGVQECVPTCDPIGSGDVPTASCPGGATGGEPIFDLTSFGEASEYWTAEAGDYPGELRANDGTFIQAAEVEVDDGSVTSMVVTVDGEGAVDVLILDDLTPEDDVPAQGLRLVHASHGAGEVDVYLDEQIAAAVAAGDDLASVDVDAGDYAVSGGEFMTFEAGMVYRAKDNGVDGAYDPTAIGLVDDEAGLRIYHGAIGGPAIDVYICALDAGDFGDCSGADPLASDLGESNFFPADGFTPVAEETFIASLAYGVLAGADPDDFADEDVVFTWGGELVAGELYQVTAFNGEDGVDVRPDALPTEVAEGAATILFQSFGSDPIDFTLTWGPIEEAFVYGDSSSGEDASYFAVEPGTYGFSLLAADETWIVSEPASVDEGEFVSTFAADREDGVTFFSTLDDFAAPSDGEGATRLIHAAGGVSAVQITEPGELDVVCTPSAVDGFGFCQEACVPYPRRVGDYGCDDETNTCLPFVARDDRPVEPQGFCSEDEGEVGAGGACTNDGFLGGDCQDFAVCLDLEDTGNAQCLPLCEPFAIGSCSEYPDFSTCSGIPPLVGQLNFSFCIDAQPGNIGDRCTEEGIACAADNSICLDMGSGPQCLGVCRAGFDDCDAFGQTCNTGDLNPDVVPTYMGLCR